MSCHRDSYGGAQTTTATEEYRRLQLRRSTDDYSYGGVQTTTATEEYRRLQQITDDYSYGGVQTTTATEEYRRLQLRRSTDDYSYGGVLGNICTGDSENNKIEKCFVLPEDHNLWI
jgi:hypothetical protein